MEGQALLTLVFHGDLGQLLPAGMATRGKVLHFLDRRASIKDVVESLGVPHTEIGRLLVNGREQDFDHIVEGEGEIEIWPLPCPVDLSIPTVLRPHPLAIVHFLVDVNVGKLASLLRMAGFDTFYQPEIGDEELADLSAGEERILLTRDVNLLKRKKVVFGHLVRAVYPRDQLVEIINLFGLRDSLRPFSRCLVCNGLLMPVAKEEIIDRLEPLTKKYYDLFHRCRDCDRIYWPGSHREKMLRDLEDIIKLDDEKG